MMVDLLTDEELAAFLGEIGMCGVDAVWYKTYDYQPDIDFQQRIEMFLQVLTVILENGLAKLQSSDRLLSGPISEQVAQFRMAWPSEDDWDEDFFWASKSGIGWTPSGLVWMVADGSEFWT